MTWREETKRVLQRYYQDPNAVVVCLAMFHRLKAIDTAQSNKDVDKVVADVLQILVDDYHILPGNPFWRQHGAVIYGDMASRFFDYLRAHKLLQVGTANLQPEQVRTNLQAYQLRKSFLGVADTILRLHVPFDVYTKNTDSLYKELTAIQEL